MWLKPVSLTSPHASLVPLSQDHAPALSKASASGQMHKLWYTTVPASDDMKAEITRRVALLDQGAMLPFTVLNADQTPVGMTTYMNVDATNRRVEIGSTWYAPSVQRTPLNTSCKRMLLAHAFDTLACNAVEFRTHRMNTQSRRAIERLGAQLDGILRAHMILENGTLRDTAVYSITLHDWPTVRAHLDWQLEKPRA
ncbi:MAG: GNAT family N-acetyltransferase [Sedimentitalea sp.]